MKTFQKICSHALTCFCVVVVLLASSLVLPKLLGLKSYIVLSGSMHPEIQTGAFAYVKPQEADTLKVNDIITFTIGENTVTHRINEITDDGFITKGDANEVPDLAPVMKNQVVGKYVFSIPYLGYFVSWLSTKAGKLTVFWIIAIMLGSSIAKTILFNEEGDIPNEKNE